MGRPRNQFPTVSHHKGSGQARVRINGKDIYLGRWGSQEARAAYSRLIGEAEVAGKTQAARRTAKNANTPTTTVSEVCLLWLDHAEATYTKNGKLTSHVGTFVTPIRVVREVYGTTPAASFGPLALEVVRSQFVKLGLGRRTANRYAGLVRKIFRWAASRELIPATVVGALATLEPLKAGRTTAPENEPIEPVADSVVDATLPHLTPVVADMVRLQRCTGMRPGEVCSLRPGDVDRADPSCWRYSPQGHKMVHKSRDRAVWIRPAGQAILSKYLLRPADSFCFSPAASAQQAREARAAKRQTPPTHGNYPGSKPPKRKPARAAGERYNTNAYRVAVVRAAKKAGVDPWHPNQLRHSFATEARRVGGLESVQALLGHAELQTSQIYAERSTELATRVARQIG